ncbi:MAG: amino acid adenylation domain-containing protein, partial [Acidobacteriota bacterium]|nr:amino acid adenylation domain-containing protein [Acidobacteriota bacterium]
MVSPPERHQLLLEWTPRQPSPAVAESLLAVFDQRVQAAPDAPAVSDEAETLTYGELDARANRLAHELMARGVGPEVKVGLCLQRSSWLVVGILGILKAGGAYLPLDPAHPKARLAFSLEDAGAQLMLSDQATLDELPEHGGEVLVLDRDWGDLARHPETPPEISLDRANLAYVIYTSGSTGQPKGVQITHQQVLRLFAATEPWYEFGPQDVWTLFHSYAFDFSVWELWGALLYGGRVVVVPYWTSRTPADFYRLLAAEGVTVLNQTPSNFRQLVAAEGELLAAGEGAGQEELPELALRHVIFGAEALELKALEPWFQRHGDRIPRLVNMYGITETTVHVTYRPVRSEDLEHAFRSPIGRPIPDLDLFLLDPQGRPTPVGVPGELHVGGGGLARGYLRRPGLTAERFVPNPFATSPGTRLYRSGDLARRLADGDVEYLGRIDHQVKVRGFRIELGEIESTLAGSENVAQSVVMAHDSGDAGAQLVAYVVPAAEQSVDVEGLRAHLRARLPEYMVPAVFMPLEELPLTVNGKIDRRALPAPDAAERTTGYVAPRTTSEEVVASVWSQVLGVEEVGALDDFFDLGGHSLLATQIVSRLNKALDTRVTLRQLFENPTVEALAATVERARREGGQRPPLQPMPRDTALPLSFAQQRLWFLEQLEPEGAGYNIPMPLRAIGPLDARLVERALNHIVARHEVLRTRFLERDGKPEQVIDAARERLLPVVDLQGLPEAAREAEGERLAVGDAFRLFDLSVDWPLRASLLRLEPERTIVLFTMHHIASDGWSMGLLVDEVSAFYIAHREGQEPDLPELPVQYADYAIWQRQWLEGEVLASELSYWREQLGESPPPLELPFDRRRPIDPTHAAADRSMQFSMELRRDLEELGKSSRATLFMVLLAGFQVLLARHCGQPRVTVGTPVAGRTEPAIEDLIGFFINTLVLSTDLSERPTFRALLEQVRDVSLGAHDHQDVPFEKLVEELQPERDLDHSPLFQVMFVLQNAQGEDLELPELVLEPLNEETKRANFDIVLQVEERPEGLDVMLEYRAEVFDSTTMERWLDHYRNLLTAAMATPDEVVFHLPLLEASERHQLADEWPRSMADYPRRASVVELFAAVAAERPEAVAVVAGEDTLTYGELDRRARSLAIYLRERGVGFEVPVGLCLERSADLVVAHLAVLWAGGAYVPLAADYPEERLRFMLQDAGVELVLTEAGVADGLPVDGSADWVYLSEALAEATSVQASSESLAMPLPEQLAYVMYTSGSTGRPKGVAVSHRSVVRLVRGSNFADLGPSQVFLQLAPVSFDAATLELWAPLLNGGKLVMMPPEKPSPETVEAVIRDHGVTAAWLTAGFFHLMVDERVEGLQPLRQLLAGGDALSPERVRRVLELEDGPRVINGYGPTENTTFTSCYPMDHPEQVAATVSIGRPVSNTSVYVLDRFGEVVPQGVFGELLTGGDGLARGYLGQPVLTAERFVPSPFGEGERLYRSGDVVRWIDGGRLEFSGRSDFQVKVRGFRIEPGEVEAALLGHPQVRQAVVLARETAGGDKRLVAYVVPPEGSEADPADLREYLSASLPDYMVPSAFVPLTELPLTANDKLDRRALPAPEGERGAEAGRYIAPRNVTEGVLAEIWAQVLELDRVGVEDDFFALGGHSLLATQVMSRLRQAFDLDVPLRLLFEHPNVAELALGVEAARRSELTGHAPPPMTAVPRDGELPLSFAQQRLWFIDQLEPGTPAYNIPVPMLAEGPLDLALVERCLNRIRQRHEVLRTRFEEVGGRPLQVIDDFRPSLLPVVDLQGLEEDHRQAEVQRLVDADASASFDLARGPLLRARALRLEERSSAMLFTMHHIVSDGWSMGVLVDEVTALYRALQEGEEPDLPELPIQYADFASWQREWLSGEVLEAELGYWREQLAGAPPVLQLPTDHLRDPDLSLVSGSATRTFPPALAERLRQLSRERHSTLFMTLLAAFQWLLARYAGQDDLTV